MPEVPGPLFCVAKIRGTECPLWVKSGHSPTFGRCPLYPQKRTSLKPGSARREVIPLAPIKSLLAYRLAGTVCSQRAIKPPTTPPTIGATQNSQRQDSETPPPKIAVAVERAGLTDALLIGMATR